MNGKIKLEQKEIKVFKTTIILLLLYYKTL